MMSMVGEPGVNVFLDFDSMSRTPMGAPHMDMNDLTQLHVPQICQHLMTGKYS
jgi:hypothetical protein